MGAHSHEWKERFLTALGLVPVVQYACDAASVQRCTAYRARESDEDFAKAWADAMEAGVDRAEREAFRRAVEGVNKPVIFQGQRTPIYATDENGDYVRAAVDTGLKDKNGQPVTEMRLVQEKDAKGKLVWLTTNETSDTLLSLVLKGRRKAVYAERTEITGADGAPLAVKDETTRAARLAALLDAAKLRKEAEDLG